MLLGISKQLISTGVFLLFIMPVSAQSSRSYRYKVSDGEKISHSVSDDGSIVLNYSVPEVELNSVENENGSFFRLSVPEHVHSTDAGNPELPVFSKLITIPEGSVYKIRISGVKSRKIDPSGRKFKGILYPAQESESKQLQQQKPVFKVNRKIYEQKGLIRSDTVKIEPLGRIRGNNLANLSIHPARYNPHTNTIEMITSMKVEIIFSGSTEDQSRRSSKGSGPFDATLSKGILNYTSGLINGYSEKPMGMIILTDTSYRKFLKPYFDWKTQKGFKLTVLYKGAAFAGTTYTELKDTIKKIYNSATETSPAPDYLLIIGDVNKIPYYQPGSYKTDLYYGEFDGNGDYFPDMYVGRLPVRDTTEVKTVISKLIQYEKFDFDASNSFDTRALATTGRDFDHAVFMDGQVRYLVTNYLTEENNIDEYHFYHYAEPDLTKQKDSIISIINKGASFINYTGHGDASGWLHLNIKVADTARMTNKNMYPFIISNACENSQYFNSSSFGNNLVLAKGKGAIGFIGCSYPSYWNEDYYWAVGMGSISANPDYADKGFGVFDRIFHTHDELPSDWNYTAGQMNYAGNLSVSSSTSTLKKRYWETYNIVGDPSIIPIFGKPESFIVDLPDTIPDGMKSITLAADPFAYVAISHFDTLWDASFCSPSGDVTLDLPGTSDDSCMIVVTGQNHYPVIRKVYISEVHRQFINLDSAKIVDVTGNNNGRADFGERFNLKVTLSNLGLTNATNTRVIISSESSWLSFVKDSAYIGTLAGQSSITITDLLVVKVSEMVTDMGFATIDLAVKNDQSVKHYKIEIIVHSPELKIKGCFIDDRGSGNGDYIADAGESFKLVIRVENEGTADAAGDLTISSSSPDILIQNGTKSGIFTNGNITDIPVEVELSSSVASGEYIPVSSFLNCSPYTTNEDFEFRVGKLRENFELSSFEVFPWMNFSPVPWKITASQHRDGSFAAQSGPITHNGKSVLKIRTHYTEEDTLKFYYKVSSEAGYDFLRFRLNGINVMEKSGEIPWTLKTIVVPAGYNDFEWEFSMDKSNLGGENSSWIDLIDFATKGSVSYIQKDLSVTEIVSPVTRETYNKEPLSVKVLNTGKDTINGFYLAYQVNDQLPAVRQYFGNTVKPAGEAETVVFNQKLDLSKYGIYNIIAYVDDDKDQYNLNDTTGIQIEFRYIHELLNVYPNPFQDNFTVIINSQHGDKIKMSITGAGGAALYSREIELIRGNNSIEITDARMAAGLYYLNIRGEYLNLSVPIIRISK